MVEAANDVRGDVTAVSETAAPWWNDIVGYEVYLRSFADSNGDGIGDLPGLLSRLDHLADLGVDVVWITPFYPSPMADFGYDVAEYCDVDPRFGTLADFDEVVARAHRAGMRVVIDIVPNHTSDQHRWFQEALADPSGEARRRYLWGEPAADGGPPNNWRSHFGGPAWTLDRASGQYYCHLFLPEQPDLDWAEPSVRDAFDQILNFWLDRGVDGFRIDVAHGLVKDAHLRDNPLVEQVGPEASPRTAFQAMHHEHDLDQPSVLDIYRRWQAITRPHDAVLLGEVYLDEASDVGRYVADGDGLDLAFFFPVLHSTWDPDHLRSVVTAALDHGHGRLVWVHSSHDDPRAATRFGGGDRGRARAVAFLAFTAFLPGPLFLFQGDELGLEDADIDAAAAADPVAVRNDDASDGRDPVRTPMPWEPDSPNLGFSTGTPWLPVGRNHTGTHTVAAQRSDPASVLSTVRRLIAARRAHRPAGTEVTWTATEPSVLAYRHGSLVVILNAGEGPWSFDRDGGEIVFSTGHSSTGDGRLDISPDSAVVLRRP